MTDGTDSEFSPFRVLAVDDVSTDRLLLKTLLSRHGFEVREAGNGHEALAMLEREDFDAVVIDAVMPELDGFDFCRHVREQMGMELLPIVMVTSLDGADDITAGFHAGATDFVTKPYNGVELIARVRSSATKKRLTDRLDDTESVLFALARMVEAKDSSTRDHCDRLAHMAVVFGRDLGCSYDELQALRRGGILHDIGKLGVPDAILLKQGPLDAAEWAIMRQHPVIGHQLCSPLLTMRRTLEIIRHHHEQWDGSGYPDGLAGTDIPFLARVFQILDVYDGLSSERPYKPALPRNEVIAVMEQEAAAGCWDETLVGRFLRIVRDQPERLALPADSARADSARIVEQIIESIGRHGFR
ncbi:MAG: response regulator [Halofilum sp. (in: g-proteobacteria)]|nr:response regulator [Halofilum sp. (in: g-proteobacteria)]